MRSPVFHLRAGGDRDRLVRPPGPLLSVQHQKTGVAIMSTPIIGPLGLSLRDSLLLATIVASMALSACMTSQEKKQTEEKVEQIKADARARLEHEQQQQQQQEEQEKQENPATMAAREAALKEWLTKWVKDNEPYVRGLCATEPGIEHQWTWDNFKVAVSTDPQHASKARDTGRPVIKCEDLLVPKTSALGYTWSNAQGDSRHV